MASVISASTTSATALNMSADTTGVLQLATGATPTTAVTIDTSQNVGIGTSSPAARLDIGSGNLNFSSTAQRITGDFSNATVASRVAFQTSTTNGATRLMVIPNGTSDVAAINCINNSDPTNASWASFQVQQSSDVRIQSAIAGTGTYLPMTFYTGGSERMRIDSSGNLAIGTSSALGKMSLYWNNATQQGFTLQASTTTFNGSPIVFYNSSGGLSGFVGQTATTISYNTSSDYRLKDNIALMTGALDTITKLKPVTYNWKVDGSKGQGFIAHELAEVVPDCVSGEKDAVDEEGNIKPQGIDTSFLVATLTAAIQEQQTIINDLKARIETLEAK